MKKLLLFLVMVLSVADVSAMDHRHPAPAQATGISKKKLTAIIAALAMLAEAQRENSYVREFGRSIRDSQPGKWVGDKMSRGADWVANTRAGKWIGEKAHDAYDWAADSKAGQWVGERSSEAYDWTTERAGAAGDWAAENATAARDWVAETELAQKVKGIMDRSGETTN